MSDDIDDIELDIILFGTQENVISNRIVCKPASDSPRICGPYYLPKYRHRLEKTYNEDTDKWEITVVGKWDNKAQEWRSLCPSNKPINLTAPIKKLFETEPYDMDDDLDNLNDLDNNYDVSTYLDSFHIKFKENNK